MAIIQIPRPKSSIDLNRPINALLQSQVQHLQHAETRLPTKYRSKIYGHAIRTEGEAAEYIRDVTEAIHRAHKDAAKERSKRTKARTSGPSSKKPPNPRTKARRKNKSAGGGNQ